MGDGISPLVEEEKGSAGENWTRVFLPCLRCPLFVFLLGLEPRGPRTSLRHGNRWEAGCGAGCSARHRREILDVPGW